MANTSSAGQRPLTHYALLSIGVAILTLVLKFLAWRMTGSVGLLSDVLETLVNLVAAVLAYASLSVAALPADEEHTHGHTKVEYFASGMEGALILVAAVGIAWNAIVRFMQPQALLEIGPGLTVSLVATLPNLVVALLLKRVGEQRHSVTLVADGKHLMVDVWTSAAVIVGVLLVSITGWQRCDPLIGLAVAVHIVFTGVRLIHDAMQGLMDAGLPEVELEKVRRIFAKYFVSDGVGYHALRTRQAGAWRFLSVHVLVPGEWTVARAHDLIEKIEAEICTELKRITVLTHLEPLEDPTSWEDIELERKQKQDLSAAT